MKYLDLTFADGARNLACDELLLTLCEAGAIDQTLRLWEPCEYFAVLGHSNRIASEINIAACAAENVPIFRRSSGGGAVLQGPGCLNYSLVLENAPRGALGDIAASFKRVLEPHRRLLSRMLSREVDIEGTSDLTLAGRKFSGNSQYRKTAYTLYHGTFLIGLDFSIIEKCLRMPSRKPAYRASRAHADFLTHLPVEPGRLRESLRQEWAAGEEFGPFPAAELDQLVRERYERREWNFKF
jgi:lipoate-protein ligase A